MEIQTSMGSFTVELYQKHAPKTCKNFYELARWAACRACSRELRRRAKLGRHDLFPFPPITGSAPCWICLRASVAAAELIKTGLRRVSAKHKKVVNVFGSVSAGKGTMMAPS